MDHSELHIFIGERDGAGDYVVARSAADAAALLLQITDDAEMAEETRWRQWPDEEPFGMTEYDEPGQPCVKRAVSRWTAAGRRYLGGYA